MASWLSAAACWVSSLLTLNYGPRRIAGLRRRTTTDLEFRPFPWVALAFSIAPTSLLAGIYRVSAAAGGSEVLAGSGAGFAASAAGWLLHNAIHHRIDLASPHLRWLLNRDPAGYRDHASGRLLPGHFMAVQFTAFFVALWAMIGLLKYHALTIGSKSLVLPTSLTFIVLLIGLAVLVLSGLAFFFDRYRVPVFLPWMALLAAASLVPGSDHFVDAIPVARRQLARPSEILAKMETPVLVCASGGGIAAAAWTAAVLANLDRQYPRRFTQSLALFSGVSGGSLGGLHFAAACRSTAGCSAAFERASRSSLDAAAWGFVGPDLIRATIPFAGIVLGHAGRGWALEQAWDPEGALRFPMSHWSPPPALVFNATVVETGAGLGLSNIDLGPALPGFASLGTIQTQFAELSPVTAARLSASFPYVTPTPRPRTVNYHIADGGYYDNYGVAAAVAFLSQAYNTPANLPKHLLLIEIRAHRAVVRPPGSAGSLLFQWRSPASTILNVRDTAQRDRNDSTLSLLARALEAQGVHLERVLYEIPDSDVPLSWHLTASQVEAIRRVWGARFENSAETRAVSRFLAQQR